MDNEPLTYESLLRIVDALGPKGPHPVLIVCDWLPGPEVYRRVCGDHEEWRCSRAAYAVLDRQAIRTEWDYPSVISGVPVSFEKSPPSDLVNEIVAWPRNVDQPRARAGGEPTHE